ncbi:MAG: hypothetical protein HKL98_06620 [Burkholderiales bacterium]|nr:hypothetical protein [Burkholderiales bacterium]
MGFYEPLFSIEVENSYFSSGSWKDLDFVPDFATEKMISSSGMLLKKTGSGIGLFCEKEREAALPLFAENGSIRFCFKATAFDRNFSTYTSMPFAGGKVLLFSNSGGRDSLARSGTASSDDFEEVEKLAGEGILGERECRIPPDFVVKILIAPQERGRRFTIRFGARESFWQYHLLGNMNRENAFIVDLDSRVEFEARGEAMLPGNRRSSVFRSKERLAVQEKTEYRFQLRERSQSGSRVLVKRLPTASGARLGSELIDERREIVLENYVNF